MPAVFDFAAIFLNLEYPKYFCKNTFFEEYMCQISSLYVNLKVIFCYKAHYYMSTYVVWIEIYAQTTAMAAILDLCKLKKKHKVFSLATKLNLLYTSV